MSSGGRAVGFVWKADNCSSPPPSSYSLSSTGVSRPPFAPHPRLPLTGGDKSKDEGVVVSEGAEAGDDIIMRGSVTD